MIPLRARPHPHHLLQTTHPPNSQIWSLHSVLRVRSASSRPRKDVLVPLWALQRPQCSFPALSSALPAMAAHPRHVVSHLHMPAHALPSLRSASPPPLLPGNPSSTLRTWLRARTPKDCKETPRPRPSHTWGPQSRETGPFCLPSQGLRHRQCSVHIS